MPQYVHQCQECGKVVEHLLPIKARNKKMICECGGRMKRLISRFSPNVWGPMTLDHIADDPMTFSNRDELRKYCREHGLESSALL